MLDSIVYLEETEMLTKENWYEVICYPLAVLIAIVLLVSAVASFGGCGGVDDGSYDYQGPNDRGDGPGEAESSGGRDDVCPQGPLVGGEHAGALERLRDRVRSLEEQLALEEESGRACEYRWHGCIDIVTECAAGQEQYREELAELGAELAECTEGLGACTEDLAGCEEDAEWCEVRLQCLVDHPGEHTGWFSVCGVEG